MSGLTLTEAQTQGIAPWDDLKLNLGVVKVYADRYPVTEGHRLFVPETDDLDGVTACFREAYKLGSQMIEHGVCEGFNIGMNKGTAAGQTVMYPHIHLILRRSGDVDDPVGGVRGVIPGQANYKKHSYKNPHDK
jgi:diadenosine tetraphosphate (Ap4A) HIT family hydrolase